MNNVSKFAEAQAMPFPRLAQSQFAPQVAVCLRKLMDILDEAERASNNQHQRFDLPIKDGYRRAS